MEELKISAKLMLEGPQHINQNVSIWLVLQSVVNNNNYCILCMVNAKKRR